MRNLTEKFKHIAAHGGIIVFFIMAFEVMIMISPFAFFFYSVFNPVLHWFERYSATSWLTVFFLPHMILPPTLLLRSVRVLGSVLFVLGFVTFVVCAAQVYLGKIFKLGIADRGLYRVIRNPQYLALGIWGVGMSILWARFLVLASLSLMFVLYYFLAKDEEKRMQGQFGEEYRIYKDRTGMFLPRPIERGFENLFRSIGNRTLKYAVVSLCVPAVVIGAGFVLREITLNSLAYASSGNVTLLSILPEDNAPMQKALGNLFKEKNPQAGAAFLEPDKDYLGYVMPPDYVMQGMIANTGEEFHLHKQHNTFALITDWVLNPFEHLRRPPSALMAKMHGMDPAVARRHHCPLAVHDPALTCDACPYKRIVFLEVNQDGDGHPSRQDALSFNARRIPVCYVDMNVNTGEIVGMKPVGKSTAWKDVPTPTI